MAPEDREGIFDGVGVGGANAGAAAGVTGATPAAAASFTFFPPSSPSLPVFASLLFLSSFPLRSLLPCGSK